MNKKIQKAVAIILGACTICSVLTFTACSKQDTTKQLVTVLYKDSNYYLTRKYNLAKKVFESKNEEDIV